MEPNSKNPTLSPEQLARFIRIETAAFASLEAWDGEEETVRTEHEDVIEELRRALEGPDAKPDREYERDELDGTEG